MSAAIDRAYQLRHLEAIYQQASFSPHFKPNPKFPGDGGHEFRIAYRDVMGYRYVIRKAPLYSDQMLWSDETEIVAEYRSLEELVGDGWRLD